MLRSFLLLLIFVQSAALPAEEQTQEFKVLMDGLVVDGSRKGVEGVSIDAEPHEFWGFTDKQALERAEEQEGAFPKAAVTGNATSGRDGKFKIEVRVTLKGQRIPKVKWGRPPNETCYAQINFSANKAGYVARAMLCMVTPIEPFNSVYISQFVPAVVVSGRAISKSDTPLADVALYLASEEEYATRAYRRPPIQPLPQTKTDKAGNFKFEGLDPFRGSGMMLIPDRENLALDPTSPQWTGLSLYSVSGELKLGDVRFWPAGSIKVVFCDAKGERANAGARLEMTEPSSGRFMMQSGFVEKGLFEYKRLPEGKYAVSGTGPEDSSIVIANVEVKGGQVTDLGVKTLIPPCDLTIKLEAPSGMKFRDAILQVRKSDGDWHSPRNEKDEFLGLPCRNESTQSGKDTFEFQRLPVGKYEVWVRSNEFATTSQVFVLSQRKETVTVKLLAGIQVKVILAGPDGRPVNGNVYLFHEASPAYGLFFETKGESPKFARSFLSENSRNVAERIWVDSDNSVQRQALLRPGKYVVLAFPERLGRLVKTDFVVAEGKDAVLRLEVKPALLRATYTQAGKPLAEAAVYLVQRDSFQFVEAIPDAASWSWPKNPIYDAKTDKKGEVSFEALAAGEYVALNASEFQYVCAFGFYIRPDEFSETLSRRFFRIESGEARQKFDFPAYKGTWLTLSVKWGRNTENNGAKLISSTPGSPPISGFGALIHFGLVAKGKYECVISGDSSRGRAAVVQKVEVSKSGEQLIKVEPAWRSVTLKIDDKDLNDREEVAFILRAAGTSSDPLCTIEPSHLVNRVELEVAPGDYVLTCCWRSQPNNNLCTAVEKLRVAGKDLKLDLKPSRAHGAISLALSMDGRSEGGPWSEVRFRLLNAAGAEVALADAGLRTVVSGSIYGVPPGTYSLELEFTNCETLRLENLSVKAGEVTTAKGKLRALKSLDCIYDAEGLTLSLLRNAQLTAYDTNNTKVQLPIKPQVVRAQYRDNALILTLKSIPLAVTKISIKISGYKEHIVNLEEVSTSCEAKLERE